MHQHLTEILSNLPVEILSGNKVIELRPHGVNKGKMVADALARLGPGLLVAIGDDQTDEDMFAAMPEGSLSIRVGPGDSRAVLRVRGVRDVRALLRALLQELPAGGAL
jgi:trehalose 6-phosphate synthase/phosphatase